jgi:ATP-dependent helicase HrpB
VSRRPKLDLPVEAVLPDIVSALATPGGAAVIVAEPGAGKTTLVPLALLDAPWRRGRILVIEPRRLAARTAASRLASLLGERVGQTVGLRMRGDTRVSAGTRVEMITDGVLTRLLQDDPSLAGVDAVIFDELHERSLDTDFGLALCLDIRAALRPELRLVAMSATIDGAAVASLLETDTIVRVNGRTFPTDVVWVGSAPRAFDAREVADACRRALRESTRDVLAFLPGAAEIRATQRALEGVGADVLPLHGSLPYTDQERALARPRDGGRKIVLATSVAETSLTIEGVDAVVDSGWSRRARFDIRRGMGGLVTGRVSQASAEQRRGRAGRTAPGRCYRLWSELEHAQLAPYDPPEVLSADQVPLAFDLVRWGDPDGSSLRWTDSPPIAGLHAARQLLRALELVDDRDRLTDHGRRAARLPLHPRLAHAVTRADELGHGWSACVVAALLGERDTGRHLGTADLDERARHLSGRAAEQADRLARLIGARDRGDSDSGSGSGGTGLAVALAYPDRVARRRGSSARYLTASGVGAQLDAHDPLAKADWIAIADLDLRAEGGDARVQLAAALATDELDLALGGQITEIEVVEWDRQRRDVRSVHERRLGAIVLSAQPITSSTATSAALLDGVRIEGLSLLPRWSATEALRGRVAFCRRTLGDEWPDLADEALLGDLDTWLAPWLAGAARRRDLERVDVAAAVRALLPPRLAARLDVLAPRQVTLPNGRVRPIDYTGEHAAVSLRLQDAFGWTDTPRIADGRVPLVLHLLSPAGRPVQITSDLAGFWRGSYAQVRAEMRGRYPKHPWPEDPTAASVRSGR